MINKEKENLQTDKENSDEIEVKVDKKILKEIEEIETKNKRDLTGLWSIPIIVASIGLFIFHMYTGWFGAYFSLIQRSIHFMFILTLTFSLFARSKKTPRDKIQFYDLIFIGISIILCYYILINYKELVWRAGAANPMDVFLGVILVFLTYFGSNPKSGGSSFNVSGSIFSFIRLSLRALYAGKVFSWNLFYKEGSLLSLSD